MSFRKTGVALVLAAAALTLVITTSGQSVAPSVSPVQVTNFPATQIIEGEVSISGSVRLSEIVRFNDILVPPVNPVSYTHLTLPTN